MQHPERRGGQDDVLLQLGLGDHLGADTLADTVVSSTSKSSDAGSEAARWKGTSCVRHRQHALVAGPQNSSVLQVVGDRFGTSHGFGLGLHVQRLRRVGDQRARKSPCLENDA